MPVFCCHVRMSLLETRVGSYMKTYFVLLPFSKPVCQCTVDWDRILASLGTWKPSFRLLALAFPSHRTDTTVALPFSLFFLSILFIERSSASLETVFIVAVDLPNLLYDAWLILLNPSRHPILFFIASTILMGAAAEVGKFLVLWFLTLCLFSSIKLTDVYFFAPSP